MIGCKVKPVEEIRSQDGLTDVGDNEGEIESSVGNANLTVHEAVAGDIRPVGCLKLPSIGSGRALLSRRGEYRPERPAIDKPSC